MQCGVGMEVTCAALKTVARKGSWVRVPRPPLDYMSIDELHPARQSVCVTPKTQPIRRRAA
jgi:hypothetical protein